tara:strand:+ start:183 stop:725 length:543 start_codon:yes stop_codon:yes gene_type:complete
MSAPGDKAKLVNLWDNSLAIETGLESVYKIEVFFMVTPKGNRAGAITIFRNNSFENVFNPALADEKLLKEMDRRASEQTEVMYQDPIKFRARDGQWIDWAMEKALELYDKFGGATIVVKAPQLKIREKRSSSAVADGRSSIDSVFVSLKDINDLLTKDFRWDPWSKTVRRGKIGREAGKR